jgi:predicted transposase YbfD/YdcC
MELTYYPYFSGVSDPRVTGRCLHLLSDILLIGLCTYLTGGSDYQDMRLFGLERGGQLGDMLSLPNGVPSEDTFERVYKSICPEELENSLRLYGRSILSDLSQKQIAIDGKKQRGVSPTTRGNQGLYLMNAWVSENRFCIAQEKVEDKSNEITAIPHVLNNIDIEDAVISIDAMGTQREIAELIVEKKGHYLLALKTNQKSLFEDVECAFKVHHGHDIHQTLDAGHGRIETRKCSILPAQDYLLEENLVAWKNLSTLIRMESIREVQGKVTQETRYYISDEKQEKAAYFNALVRGHWSIENQLHWHLDITFREDACRARAGYASQNLSILRKMALHIVSEQKDKLSLKKRLYKAALDIEYLKKLMKI